MHTPNVRLIIIDGVNCVICIARAIGFISNDHVAIVDARQHNGIIHSVPNAVE